MTSFYLLKTGEKFTTGAGREHCWVKTAHNKARKLGTLAEGVFFPTIKVRPIGLAFLRLVEAAQ